LRHGSDAAHDGPGRPECSTGRAAAVLFVMCRYRPADVVVVDERPYEIRPT
jgi:hypothetical protein